MDAIRGFAGDVERAAYHPQDDRYLLTKPEKVRHYQSSIRGLIAGDRVC